jgi:DoxX
MFDHPTPLVIPALGAIYATLAPIAEALLRVVVGLTLVPHGLRITFGCFAGSGLGVTSLKGLAAELEQGGYRPGRLWAPAIAFTQLVCGPLLALGCSRALPRYRSSSFSAYPISSDGGSAAFSGIRSGSNSRSCGASRRCFS